MANPLFSNKPKIAQKISQAVGKLPHRETTTERRKRYLHQALIYISIFVAGFVFSKVHTLLSIAN
jgi:hypothetical protein